MKKAKAKSKRITRSDHIPVTKKMLFEVRSELKGEISSLGLRIKGGFKRVDARFNHVDARFNDIDAQMKLLLSQFHGVRLLVEEQNTRNKFVLDGYISLNDRLEAVESPQKE